MNHSSSRNSVIVFFLAAFTGYTAYSASPVIQTNVSAQAITSSYWEDFMYDNGDQYGYGESAYYDAVDACDILLDSATGTSLSPGYAYNAAWSTGYGYYATTEKSHQLVSVDLRGFTNTTTQTAWIQWRIDETVQYYGLGTSTATTFYLSQAVPLNVTSSVYQVFEPPWLPWALFAEDADVNWMIGDAQVWVATKGADVQPDKVRPQEDLANTRDPINTINGSVNYDNTDISLPTPGIPLTFSRSYNSADNRTGALGSRWAHSLSWSLSQTNSIFNGSTSTWKVVRAGDGAEYKFKVATNGYVSPFDINWRLVDRTNSTFALTIPPSFEYRFASNGTLAAIADGFSNVVSLVYSNSSQLIRADHNGGQSLTFAYAGDKITSVVSPDPGLSMSFSYNSLGELTNATRTVSGRAETTAYSYDTSTNHLLTLRVNSNGDQFTYGYETNAGALTSRGVYMTLNTNWYTHNVAYSNSWNQTFVTYARGDTNQTFTYNLNPIIQRVIEIDSPAQDVRSRFEYDDYGNATNEIFEDDSTGASLVTMRRFGGFHNITNESIGLNTASTNITRYYWDTNLQAATNITDAEGRKFDYEYTPAGALSAVKSTPVAGSTLATRYAYTSNGLLSAVTNAASHWVQYSQDTNGYLSQIKPQVGPVISYSNSALGYVEKVIMPGVSGNRITTFGVDKLGRINSVIYPNGAVEGMGYDSLGNMTAFTNVEGSVSLQDYLPARKLSQMVHKGWDGLNITNSFNFDRQFNSLSVVDGLGRKVEAYSLDLQDRPVAVTNVDGRVMTIAYSVGSLIGSINRFDGTAVSNSYNSDVQLIKVSYPDAAIGFSYYRNGLIKTSSNSFGVVSNRFDEANRLVGTKSQFGSLTGDVQYVLDSVANPTNTTTSIAGRTLACIRTFDAAERLASVSATSSTTSSAVFGYSYNTNNGLVATVTNQSIGGKVENLFDDMNRPISIVWKNAQGVTLKSFAYSYSLAGMITNITTETGEKLAYTYDSLQRLTSEKRISTGGETLYQAGYTYDSADNRLTKTLNGVTVNYSYPYGNQGNHLPSWAASSTNDYAAGRTVVVSGHSSETIGANSSFGTLWVSNVTAVVPSISGTNFSANVFVLGAGTQQVIAAIGDMAGNVCRATNTVTTRIITNAVYEYSAAGCVTNLKFSGISYSQKQIGLEWNGQYQLARVRDAGAVVENYGYDSLGRRAWIGNGSSTNWMVYDGQQVVADVNSTGGVIRSYCWGAGIDQMLSMTVWTGATVKTYYPMRDHLGSIHALVDGSGTIVESYSFDAFGRVLGIYNGSGVLLTESAIGNRYLWQGREYSFKTGMYYFRARYYDPVSGRWLSNDPLGIAGGLNQYVFCANNPVNFRDPDGRTPWMLIGAAVGGGLDLAVQFAQGSGFSGINWVSVVASATSGALGVGLGANVARLTASVAARAALNAAGSAAIGAGVQVARNGIEGNPLGTGVRDATVVSGVLGGVGSATGDLIERGIISMSQNSRYIQNLLDGGALEGSRPGYLLPGEILPPSAGSTAGTAIGIGISNMGPLLPSGGSKSCP